GGAGRCAVARARAGGRCDRAAVGCGCRGAGLAERLVRRLSGHGRATRRRVAVRTGSLDTRPLDSPCRHPPRRRLCFEAAMASEPYLASPAPDTVLALVAAELKKDSALAKACAKAGEVLVYDVAKRRLSEWVAKQFSDRGVRVDPEAARLLVEVVGEDPEELASEVDKISTWA